MIVLFAVFFSFHTYRVSRSGPLMGDVALEMKSASGAMNACIISAASETRYLKSVWFYTVYECMSQGSVLGIFEIS